MSVGDEKFWFVNSIVGCLLRRLYAFGVVIWLFFFDWMVFVCIVFVVFSNVGCLFVYVLRLIGIERVGCIYYINILLKKWWFFICNILGFFFFINFLFGWKCIYMLIVFYVRKIFNEEYFFINNEKGFWSYIFIML